MNNAQAPLQEVLQEALGADAVMEFLCTTAGRQYCYRLCPRVLGDPIHRAEAIREIRAIATAVLPGFAFG